MLDEKMMKLMKKKGEKKLSDNEKEAKLSVAKEMRDMASGMMGEKLKGLKKVTVASDSKEGIEEGLEKAKDMVEEMPGEEKPEMEASESEESEEMSPEDIDQKIQELLKLKEELKNKSE